jgi:hypothetical protein
MSLQCIPLYTPVVITVDVSIIDVAVATTIAIVDANTVVVVVVDDIVISVVATVCEINCGVVQRCSV